MKFRYTGDDARVFPFATFVVVLPDESGGDVVAERPRGHVEPGDVVDCDDNPDPQFFDDDDSDDSAVVAGDSTDLAGDDSGDDSTDDLAGALTDAFTDAEPSHKEKN